jgi:1-phosphofructokinase
VAVFGPHPLLTVTVEALGSGSQTPGIAEDIHFHAGGQGVWVTRMAGMMGAEPVLCGFIGGETGAVLRPLLDALPGSLRLVGTTGDSGCYVMDRRDGERHLVAQALSPPPSRHELDDLFSATCATALGSRVLVLCNPLPGDGLPLEVYSDLVADVRANGTPVLVDLSSPRLDHALAGGPDLVKLNDWELAEFVSGPVSEPRQMRAAAERLRERGARSVVVTRGERPALALHGDEAYELIPPSFERGSREGCGDSMMGALAAAWANDVEWIDAVVQGTAAGAANFLRHGLGTGSRSIVEELVTRVEVRRL